MRGIATTLVIIVTAIVILVAALVILTIFGGGVEPVVEWTSKQSLCMTEYSSICVTTDKEPPTWYAKARVTVLGAEFKFCSCDDLVDGCQCTNKVATGCTPVSNPACLA